MYDYFVNTELARLTIILGIVVATLVYKQTGLTLGGVIVPGYLALFIVYPLNILATMLVAILAYLVVHKVLQRRFMLNGRQLFETEILVALVIQLIWNSISGYESMVETSWIPIYGIGFVLPGIITHEMGRSGWFNTLISTLLGAVLVYLIVAPLAAVQTAMADFVSPFTVSPLIRPQPSLFGFPMPLLPVGIVVSILLELLLFRWVKIRTGGYVTAAYLALLILRPLDILFVLGCSLITYIVMKRFVSGNVLAFGRIRLGVTILLGVVIAWLCEILVINFSVGTFIPWSGFVVIMPMIVSLLAVDYERQGVVYTLGGAAGMAAAVWLIMQGVTYGLQTLELGWIFHI